MPVSRFMKVCRICHKEVPKGDESKHYHEPIGNGETPPMIKSKPRLYSAECVNIKDKKNSVRCPICARPVFGGKKGMRSHLEAAH